MNMARGSFTENVLKWGQNGQVRWNFEPDVRSYIYTAVKNRLFVILSNFTELNGWLRFFFGDVFFYIKSLHWNGWGET